MRLEDPDPVVGAAGVPPASAWGWHAPWWLAGAAAVGLCAALAYGWRLAQPQEATPRYTVVPVRRGSVTMLVAANGTLQPTRAVNIGSELSGTVTQVLVDINDQVRRGQVLVALDTAKLQDQIVRSRAALAAARAGIAQSDATLAEARSALARLEEVARLSGGKVPSQAELDAGRAALARAEAAWLSAAAAMQSAQAALSTDNTNLARAAIRAPIDGVVLSRNVDPGNAVAASLQAVTLFTLAEDLRRLRLLVNVDEADVGAVRAGQAASFTVSTYPGREFPATITRVSYGSTITDNVVTYVAELAVDNDGLSLRPGMTANAAIRAGTHDGVLLVPNSALRFTPRRAAVQQGLAASLMPRLPGGAPRQAGVAGAQGGMLRTLWVAHGGQAQALQVRQGISDGRYTEVSGAGLREGLPVVVDQGATP